jgi:hypothetical protein
LGVENGDGKVAVKSVLRKHATGQGYNSCDMRDQKPTLDYAKVPPPVRKRPWWDIPLLIVIAIVLWAFICLIAVAISNRSYF